MPFADQSVGAFLDAVASEDLTPSGGAVAAIVGAAGGALCEMACRHTAVDGDEGHTDLAALAESLETDRRRLLDLADADAAAVEAVFHGGQDEDSAEATLEHATEVPMEIAAASLEVLDRAVTVTASANPRAVPDATTGAYLAHAAVQASTATVRANLEAIDDDAFVARVRERVTEIDRDATSALERVTEHAD